MPSGRAVALRVGAPVPRARLHLRRRARLHRCARTRSDPAIALHFSCTIGHSVESFHFVLLIVTHSDRWHVHCAQTAPTRTPTSAALVCTPAACGLLRGFRGFREVPLSQVEDSRWPILCAQRVDQPVNSSRSSCAIGTCRSLRCSSGLRARRPRRHRSRIGSPSRAASQTCSAGASVYAFHFHTRIHNSLCLRRAFTQKLLFGPNKVLKDRVSNIWRAGRECRKQVRRDCELWYSPSNRATGPRSRRLASRPPHGSTSHGLLRSWWTLAFRPDGYRHLKILFCQLHSIE